MQCKDMLTIPQVVHDVIGVEEATQRLNKILEAKQRYNPWLLVVVYGLASASVAPFGMSQYYQYLEALLLTRLQLFKGG